MNTEKKMDFLRAAIDSEDQLEAPTVEHVRFKVRSGIDFPVKRRLKAQGTSMMQKMKSVTSIVE